MPTDKERIELFRRAAEVIAPGGRLPQMIGEELPNLVLYKQDERTRAFAYNEGDFVASLGLLRTLRVVRKESLASGHA